MPILINLNIWVSFFEQLLKVISKASIEVLPAQLLIIADGKDFADAFVHTHRGCSQGSTSEIK